MDVGWMDDALIIVHWLQTAGRRGGEGLRLVTVKTSCHMTSWSLVRLLPSSCLPRTWGVLLQLFLSGSFRNLTAAAPRSSWKKKPRCTVAALVRKAVR